MRDDILDAGPLAPASPGEVRAFEAGGQHIAVAHVDGNWYAFADACTHHDCPLADGQLEGVTIECDCHGSRFDVRTGAVVRGPATEPIRTYPVTIRAGRVVVDLDAAPR